MPKVLPWQLGRYLPPNNTPIITPLVQGSTVHESAALLTDGRVIYICSIGSDIVQGYAPSIKVFFNNDSVENVTNIFTGVQYPRATVFTPPTGGLYLLVSWSTPPDGTNFGENLCYRSPSGLGGDWVLHGTLQRFAWGDTSFGNRNNDGATIGVPEITSSGRWVVSAPVFTNNDITVRAKGMRQGAYTSDDQGATWGLRLNVGYYLSGGTNGYGHGRNIGDLAGRTFWSSQGNVDADKDAFSDNDGAGWVTFNAISDRFDNFGLSDGTYVYNFISQGRVNRNTDPVGSLEGEPYRDYALGGGPFFNVVQDLGGWGFVSSNGQCLKQRMEIPPLRQRQRDDMRQGRGKRSQQLSGRQGWANAYL